MTTYLLPALMKGAAPLLLLAIAAVNPTKPAGLPKLMTAQATTTAPAPSSPPGVRYEVRPELTAGRLTALLVTMAFHGDADGDTVIVYPNELGASDEESDKLISDFVAEGATVQKVRPRRTRLSHVPGAPLRVSYRLNQRVAGPPGSKHTFSAIVQPDYFSVLGRSLLAWPEKRVREPAVVTFNGFPFGWAFASTLKHETQKPRTIIDVHQSTTMAGLGVILGTRELDGASIRVATDKNFQPEIDQFTELVTRIVAVGSNFWREKPSDYLVTIATLKDFSGQSALAYADGFAAYLPPYPEIYELRNTLVHEHQHKWMGQRFGGGDAWFMEGFTEYYTRNVNLMIGDYPFEVFLDRWNDLLRRYAASPYRTTSNATVQPKFFEEDAAQRIAEDRGSMVAALLDYRLRKTSGGRTSLADVLRAVMADVDADRGTGEGPERLVAKARQLAGVDLSADIERHIDRGEALTLPSDLFGICAKSKLVKEPEFDRGFVPVDPGERIVEVDPRGPAYKAGLRPGMVLVRREMRENRTSGNPFAEIVYRVRDGNGERLIRYKPSSLTRTVTVQRFTKVPAHPTSDCIERVVAMIS